MALKFLLIKMKEEYECNECGNTVTVRELLAGLQKVREEGWILREEELEEKRNLKHLRDTYIGCDKCKNGVFVKK